MKTRQLGKSSINIGEVGLGCWQFGGDFGPMEKKSALATMAAAVESGVTFFDTADVYGAGLSEALIGDFLKQTNAKIAVATKFGRDPNVYPNNYTKAALRTSVQNSIKRLGVDVIDLIQLHCIPEQVLQNGEVFQWLRDMRQEGLIRYFGASVESVEEGLLCIEQEGLLSLQVIFNIFRQKLIGDLFPKAQKKEIGIIVRLPLASGLLSGKFTPKTQFVETDHRNYNRDGQHFNVGETFAGLPFEKGLELVDGVRTLLPAHLSMTQMALRWILDYDAVSVIIPGASSPEQARFNAAVSEFDPLPGELHDALAQFYSEKVFSHIRGPY